MLKFRGFLISAMVLTPVLGLPWLVSFLNLVIVGIEDMTVHDIIGKFIGWIFICLNAPSGILFLIIVANRVKEFRAVKHRKDISTRLTSVTSGVHTLNRPKPVSSAAERYRRPVSGMRNVSNPKRLIPVHSEKLETARFASDVKSKEIDHDKMEIPTGCPPRPTLPRGYNSLTSQYSIDQNTYVCEDADRIYYNSLYVSIEDLTKDTSVNKPIEGNSVISENIYQNISTIEQGATPKELPVISEDLAIPNPLFETFGQIEVDVPITCAALKSSKTSPYASNVSLHKISSDKVPNSGSTTFANINAGLVLTDETEFGSHRVSPSFERETDEGFLRRSLNKIRNSFKLSQSTIPQLIPDTAISPTPTPKQSSAVPQNRYIEHLNKLKKKNLPTKESVILDNLLVIPPKSGSVSPINIPKRPTPYSGSRVKNLREKFDSFSIPEPQPITKPPARPPRYVPMEEIHLSSKEATPEVPTKNILLTTTDVEPEIHRSISSIVIDEEPPSLNTLSTDFYNPFITTNFTQVSEEVRSPTKPIINSTTTDTLPSPSVYDPKEPHPAVELRQTRFSIHSTSFDQDQASCASSVVSSPTSSIIISSQPKDDITKLPNTRDTQPVPKRNSANLDGIRKAPSPRKIVIRPLSSTHQNTKIDTGIYSSSRSPVKLRQMQFSPNSEDQDTLSNASSNNSLTKPISFTVRPPQDLTSVFASKHKAPTSPNTEQDTPSSPPGERPQAKLSRTNAVEDEHLSPNLSFQLSSGEHGAFTPPLRPNTSSTASSESTASQKLSDPSGLLSPTRKRSNSKISDKISFFDNVSQNYMPQTLPRKTSVQQTRSTALTRDLTHTVSSVKGMTQSTSLNNFNATCNSEQISSPTVQSPPVSESTETLLTEL